MVLFSFGYQKYTVSRTANSRLINIVLLDVYWRDNGTVELHRERKFILHLRRFFFSFFNSFPCYSDKCIGRHKNGKKNSLSGSYF